MKGKFSLPGLLLGAITALAAGLWVSHHSFAWLLIAVAVGLVMGAAGIGWRNEISGRNTSDQVGCFESPSAFCEGDAADSPKTGLAGS